MEQGVQDEPTKTAGTELEGFRLPGTPLFYPTVHKAPSTLEGRG